MKTCLLCERVTLKLNVHFEKHMPQTALYTPTHAVWVAHIAAHSSPLFMSTDLSWEKNLDKQGVEVLPCFLLGWTTGIRSTGVASGTTDQRNPGGAI